VTLGRYHLSPRTGFEWVRACEQVELDRPFGVAELAELDERARSAATQ
jgi:hypothetical protein